MHADCDVASQSVAGGLEALWSLVFIQGYPVDFGFSKGLSHSFVEWRWGRGLLCMEFYMVSYIFPVGLEMGGTWVLSDFVVED